MTPGLVSYETSPTRPRGEPIVLDPRKSRISRMRAGVVTSSRLHCEAQEQTQGQFWCWMVTLTYAKPDAWTPLHITKAIDQFRVAAKRRGIPTRYVWVAEIQPGRLMRTGEPVVHYHVLLWLPCGLNPGHWDTGRGCLGSSLSPLWPHGMSNTKRVFAPVKYAAKYASKGTTEAERFPKGARMHASGGLDTWAKAELRWWRAPRWVRDLCNISDLPARSSGGYVLRKTGEFISSPWSFIGMVGGFAWLAPADSPYAGLSVSELFSYRAAK